MPEPHLLREGTDRLAATRRARWIELVDQSLEPEAFPWEPLARDQPIGFVSTLVLTKC